MSPSFSRCCQVALALAVMLVLYGYSLCLDIPLLNAAEGLHAAISQEMVETGDWITPRFRGQPFYDKPPLFFWAQALSLTFFGMNELAVRLPGLLFGLAGAITTALVAGRLFDRPTALVAGFFQATFIVPLALAQAGMHDVALVPFTNLAILSALHWLAGSDRRQQIGWAAATGISMGLACLTKGLLGPVCILLAVGSYLLENRNWPALNWRALVAAAIAMLLVAVPWYVLMELRNPGYASYYFIQRHLLGFATTTQLHGREPWWYYLPVFLGGSLPWLIYLPAAAGHYLAIRGVETLAEERRKQLFLWIWLLGYLAFLSAARSKFVNYLLPLFPAIAILAARVWTLLASGKLYPGAARFASRIFRQSAIVAPLMLPAALAITSWRFHLPYGWKFYAVATLAGLAAWAPSFRWRPANLSRTMLLLGVAMAAQFAVIITCIVPPIADTISARELAAYLNRSSHLPPRIFTAEEQIGALVFYLRPHLRREFHLDDIDREKAIWSGNFAAPPGSLFVIPERRLARHQKRLQLEGLPFDQAGSYRVYLAADLDARLHTAATNPRRGLSR